MKKIIKNLNENKTVLLYNGDWEKYFYDIENESYDFYYVPSPDDRELFETFFEYCPKNGKKISKLTSYTREEIKLLKDYVDVIEIEDFTKLVDFIDVLNDVDVYVPIMNDEEYKKYGIRSVNYMDREFEKLKFYKLEVGFEGKNSIIDYSIGKIELIKRVNQEIEKLDKLEQEQFKTLRGGIFDLMVIAKAKFNQETFKIVRTVWDQYKNKFDEIIFIPLTKSQNKFRTKSEIEMQRLNSIFINLLKEENDYNNN